MVSTPRSSVHGSFVPISRSLTGASDAHLTVNRYRGSDVEREPACPARGAVAGGAAAALRDHLADGGTRSNRLVPAARRRPGGGSAPGNPAAKYAEEMEHAAMVLEWIRRRNSDFGERLRTY